MADFPATMVMGRLRSFLEQIPSTGVPQKVTTGYLQSRGYKSSNDRTIIPVLKHIGLIDASGVPTSSWQKLRDRQASPVVMANLVRRSYSALFDIYPNAERQSDQVIRDFMRTKSKAGDRMVIAMVGTFKTLCSLADFSSMNPDESTAALGDGLSYPSPGRKVNSPKNNQVLTVASAPSANITINLEVKLPEVADYEYVDAIFESIARHILRRSSTPIDAEYEDLNDLASSSNDVPSDDDNDLNAGQESLFS